MANWKKVVVSGSSPEFLNVTSSGNISASGKLYGGLDENSDQTYVVVYNPDTGELEYKLLNLINATRAPELYLLDFDDNSAEDVQDFKFSFDSSSATGNPIQAPFVLSASIGGAYDHAISTNDATFPAIDINDEWNSLVTPDNEYFNPDTPINQTSSQAEGNASGPGNVRYGLINKTSATPIEDITLRFQSVAGTTTATPSPTGGPYSARGFDSPAPGDEGEIRVYVNTMELDTPTATFDIDPAVGNITTPNGNVTPNISVSSSNLDGVDVDGLKCNRTGTITIDTSLQNDGYNYAFAFYTGSRGSNQVRALTSFVEWFYDDNGQAQSMVSSLDGSPDFSLSGDTHYISGIKYYGPSATGTYKQRYTCTNQYRNIYPVSNGLTFTNLTTDTVDTISITQSGIYLDSPPYKQTLNATQASQTRGLSALAVNTLSYTSDTNLTASATLVFNNNTNYLHAPSTFYFETSDGSAPFNDYVSEDVAEVDVDVSFTHPNKSNTSAIGNNVQDYLINALTSGSTDEEKYEQFRGERYRIPSQSYTHNSFTPSSHTWNSSNTLVDTGTSGYNTGLLEYGSYLVYPNKAGKTADPGDFSSAEGATQDNDYSTGTTGTREYFRYFKLGSSSGGSKDFQFEFKGVGKIVSSSTSLSADSQNMHIFVQRLGDGTNSNPNSSFLTQIDAINSSVYAGNTFLNNSHYIPLDNNENNITYNHSTNSIGTPSVNMPTGVVAVLDNVNSNALYNNEYILLRIVVDQSWTGYLDAVSLRVGQYNASTSVQLQSISTH